MNIERLKELFTPDFENGLLYRKLSQGGKKSGEVAGSLNKQGYVKVGVDGKTEYVHRILWAMYNDGVTGETIDHKDGDRSNNRISNLRYASRSQQVQNTKLKRNNTTGVKGVSFCRLSGLYRAELRVSRVRVFDRKYTTIEEAEQALIQARKQYHGEFSNNGVP